MKVLFCFLISIRYHQNTSHHHYGNSRYPPPMRPNTCCVSLRVGSREFIGEGKTVQAARHNAASKALAIIRVLPFPEFSGASDVVENTEPKSVNDEFLDESAELKSPISLVHEVALKRNLTVIFEVVQESGPAHMRTFITRFGNIYSFYVYMFITFWDVLSRSPKQYENSIITIFLPPQARLIKIFIDLHKFKI